jgi:protein-S-isoprenylcysteine O-methyltransferase Ste14
VNPFIYRSANMPLFLRALFAFLLMPGMVAGVLPCLIWQGSLQTGNLAGWLVLGIGSCILTSCVWAFYQNGKGTLAPWRPPENLVTNGLYRYSRNPMYIGVELMLLGWALAGNQRGLWFYAAIIAMLFHLRVVLYEEPWQQRTFGADWENYKSKVRRWL